MKIAFCITRMNEYGGAQIHLRDLCVWLKNQGHEVFVLSGCPGRLSTFLVTQDIKFINVPDLQRVIHPLRDLRAYYQIRKVLLDAKPDIVACHSSKAGLLGRLAAKSLGIPVTFTAHGWAFTAGVPIISRAIYWTLEKMASYFSDKIITVSEYDRNLALKAYVGNSEGIISIHNGIPETEVLSRVVRDGEPLELLMVARIGAQKDHQRLLRVLGECLDIHWTLNFVGGGDDSALRSMVDCMGFASRINFLGEREDVPELMRKADVFLLVSNWEGFPLSILEAMRSGLPVIASDVGGVGEAIVHEKTGWLVEAGNDESLLKALRILLVDRERLLNMGIEGRKRFEDKFTFPDMAQKTLSVYQSILRANY